MKKLLIATNNQAKFVYFQELFQDLGIQLLSLKDCGIGQEVVESGKNEIENALIKARFYCGLNSEACFADDAGLYVDALNGEPGVQVRRWGGLFPDSIGDQEWLDFFLQKMKNVPLAKRTAKFKIGRAVVAPDGQEHLIQWQRNIILAEKPDWSHNTPGWPLSTLCIDQRFNKYWAELNKAEKQVYERDNLAELVKILDHIFI
jgi:XTP/dITP diphosphohydrolase